MSEAPGMQTTEVRAAIRSGARVFVRVEMKKGPIFLMHVTKAQAEAIIQHATQFNGRIDATLNEFNELVIG